MLELAPLRSGITVFKKCPILISLCYKVFDVHLKQVYFLFQKFMFIIIKVMLIINKDWVKTCTASAPPSYPNNVSYINELKNSTKLWDLIYNTQCYFNRFELSTLNTDSGCFQSLHTFNITSTSLRNKICLSKQTFRGKWGEKKNLMVCPFQSLQPAISRAKTTCIAKEIFSLF